MTAAEMMDELKRLSIENARLRKARDSKAPGAIEYLDAYVSSPYHVNAVVHPKVKIVLSGRRPEGPFVETFAIGDSAAYCGYNFTYFGTVVSVGPQTITIDTGCGGRKRRLKIRDFCFWNSQSKEASHKERANWTD